MDNKKKEKEEKQMLIEEKEFIDVLSTNEMNLLVERLQETLEKQIQRRRTRILRNWFKRLTISVPTIATLVCVFLWIRTEPKPHRKVVPISKKEQPQQKCGVKGSNPCSQQIPKQLSMRIGLLGRQGNTKRELSSGAKVLAGKEIVFNFFPSFPGGYIYLFSINQKRHIEVLLPRIHNKPRYIKLTKRGYLPMEDGKVLGYPLPLQQETIWFISLQSKKPLSTREIGSLKAIFSNFYPQLQADSSKAEAINLILKKNLFAFSLTTVLSVRE